MFGRKLTDIQRMISLEFDRFRVADVNLSPTFANWDPNLTELLRDQSVVAFVVAGPLPDGCYWSGMK
jgi:hypothetical protein